MSEKFKIEAHGDVEIEPGGDTASMSKVTGVTYMGQRIDAELEELRWRKFPVLSDGHVCLVDWMGSDDAVVQAARVSYGKGTKKVSDDRGLIRYLMRNRHSTPFEMCEVKLRVRVPMDAWRQWIRHRTANVNEYSTRYSEAIDSQDKTPPDQWRSQSKSNKQGSGEFLPVDDGGPSGSYFTEEESAFHDHAWRVYKERVDAGVAREQARKDLPLSTYTEAYWKIDLHNLFHFLSLRMDSHAQKEIRDYANIIGNEIVAKLYPLCWEAFVDYRLKGMFLSRLDLEVIRTYFESVGIQISEREVSDITHHIENKRERDECLAKLKRLGLADEECRT